VSVRRGAGFVWDPRVASHVYREDHPLKPRRLIGVRDTLERLGAFQRTDARLLAPRDATRAEIERVHAPEYVEAIMQASAEPDMDYSEYGLSAWGDTPPFAGMHEVSLLTTGGSIVAMEEVVERRVGVAVNYSGGLHHAMRRRASGFCIYNDPAIVCGLLADRGLRVAYVDIDAHHGDGVQAAFYDQPEVLTISLHERGDRLFPGTGFAEEIGEGAARGYAVNLPLEPYTDDVVYQEAFEAIVPPIVRAFRPDVVVAQLGIDSHRTDPLTHLALSVDGFGAVVRRIVALSPGLCALGGGGYDLANVARAWTLAWALMNEVPLPDELPPAFLALAAPYLAGRRTFADRLPPVPARASQAARAFATSQVATLRRLVFPLLGVAVASH
jgi:acetoin utilization protein AcuC